jgi:hypothetical protein
MAFDRGTIGGCSFPDRLELIVRVEKTANERGADWPHPDVGTYYTLFSTHSPNPSRTTS